MPSKTPKQARFMRMASTAKGRRKARSKLPPVKVAKEFVAADSRKARKRKARKRK